MDEECRAKDKMFSKQDFLLFDKFVRFLYRNLMINGKFETNLELPLPIDHLQLHKFH